MRDGWMDAGWMAGYSKQMGRSDDEVKGSKCFDFYRFCGCPRGIPNWLEVLSA